MFDGMLGDIVTSAPSEFRNVITEDLLYSGEYVNNTDIEIVLQPKP